MWGESNRCRLRCFYIQYLVVASFLFLIWRRMCPNQHWLNVLDLSIFLHNLTVWYNVYLYTWYRRLLSGVVSFLWHLNLLGFYFLYSNYFLLFVKVLVTSTVRFSSALVTKKSSVYHTQVWIFVWRRFSPVITHSPAASLTLNSVQLPYALI